ncbi:MAG: hypothetical protein R6W06_00065, partial [Prochlorococcaceae cyanobacterium]
MALALVFSAAVFPHQGADGDQVGDVRHGLAFTALVLVQLNRPAEGIDVALAVGALWWGIGHGVSCRLGSVIGRGIQASAWACWIGAPAKVAASVGRALPEDALDFCVHPDRRIVDLRVPLVQRLC